MIWFGPWIWSGLLQDISWKILSSYLAWFNRYILRLTFNFASWKAGFKILLCFLHFSPSKAITPVINKSISGFFVLKLFWKLSDLDTISFASWGSVMCTLGICPAHVKDFLPAKNKNYENQRKRKSKWKLPLLQIVMTKTWTVVS